MIVSAGEQPRDPALQHPAVTSGRPSESCRSDRGCLELDCGDGRSLRGWSPPPLPADTRSKRRVDLLVPRTGMAACVYLLSVAALLGMAAHLPLRPALIFDGLAALAGGSWCSINFWRCRHAHCVVTGFGWLALGGFAFLEAGLGQSLIGGDEQLVFVVVLVVGLAFEAAWSRATGGNAVVARQR